MWCKVSIIVCIFILNSVSVLNSKHVVVSDEVYDLTWSFGNNSIYWPGQQPFVFTKQETVSGDIYTWDFDNNTIYVSGMRRFSFTKQTGTHDRGYWYSANEFCAAEHGGTHFDAPYHFDQSGWKVTDVPVSRLFAKGALIDLTNEHKLLGRNIRLTVKHLQDWETRNGKFESGSILLVQFGRSKHWQNRTEYLDIDENGTTMNFPGVSKEAAQWIAETGTFFGVGLDTPSIDPGNSTDFIAHRIFAEHSMYNLENVKLLDPLPEIGFDLIVAPMKIEEGTGAPVRIFAKVRNSSH